MSDQQKDVDNCKWTRMPAFVGNCVAVVSISLIYYHFDLSFRLFHAADIFKQNNAHKIMADYLYFLVISMSLFVHILLMLKEYQLPLRRLHLEVLYDLILQFPLTLALLGGGKYNLMNLLFAFVVTVVVIGSRTRDIISAFYSKSNQHSPVDFLFYLVEIVAITSYVFLVWNSVWVPAFENLFVLATVPYTASTCAMVIFCVTVWTMVVDYKMYTTLPTSRKNND